MAEREVIPSGTELTDEQLENIAGGVGVQQQVLMEKLWGDPHRTSNLGNTASIGSTVKGDGSV